MLSGFDWILLPMSSARHWHRNQKLMGSFTASCLRYDDHQILRWCMKLAGSWSTLHFAKLSILKMTDGTSKDELAIFVCNRGLMYLWAPNSSFQCLISLYLFPVRLWFLSVSIFFLYVIISSIPCHLMCIIFYCLFSCLTVCIHLRT
jgi:hypothetical protein